MPQHPASDSKAQIVLASASVGRLALLTSAGLAPAVCVSDVDETALLRDLPPDADVHVMTAHLAAAKAADVAAKLTRGAVPGVLPSLNQPVLVIGADSMLDLSGQVLGKARDAGEVRARWARFAGNWATLVTGHCVIELPSGATAAATVGTRILAGRPTPAELTAYIATGEPLAVAGSATIDGYGAPFIERIEGDHTNVIGLSLPRLRLLVNQLGYRWTDLWEPRPGHDPRSQGPL